MNKIAIVSKGQGRKVLDHSEGMSLVDAAITAHAESCGDFDREGYYERYKDKVLLGSVSVTCGAFSALEVSTDTKAPVLEWIGDGTQCLE